MPIWWVAGGFEVNPFGFIAAYFLAIAAAAASNSSLVYPEGGTGNL